MTSISTTTAIQPNAVSGGTGQPPPDKPPGDEPTAAPIDQVTLSEEALAVSGGTGQPDPE